MRVFYSHAGYNAEGKKVGVKQIIEHTFGVREKAMRQLFSGITFEEVQNEVDWKHFLSVIVLFHDLGKYTTFFQSYLLDLPHEKDLKQHARFGAQAVLQLIETSKELAYVGYFIIKNHHRNLHCPSSGQQDGLLDKSRFLDIQQIFNRQKEDTRTHWEQIQSELGIPTLEKLLALPERRSFSRWIEDWIEYGSSPHRYFLINYFFSLLIEGDKLDASGTVQLSRAQLPDDAVSSLIEARKSVPTEHNLLRTKVRNEVLQNLESPGILDHKLFMLTAPTGIGKTLTALDFAIKLRNRLPHNPQIITGLPFINIIEQTLTEYRNVFKETDIKILGHYQYADIFSVKDDSVTSEEEDSEKDYGRKRMELETWQADIVVTSYVQLLQTIISNKNKILLKFNHLAGAIVIMDEVQSIRLEQVPLIGAVIYFMSKHLGTRFILMTATKPLIFELAESVILKKYTPSEKINPIQLIHNPEQIFRAFHRTQIIPLIDQKINEVSDFGNLFSQYWRPEKSCLVVCNTVNRSIEVFETLKDVLKKLGASNPIYYLSTNVLPAHRMDIIMQIKAHIANREKPILVSTQVVEAGVDLDFDMGFRDLGPIDSIVQVAGRINRENSADRKYSPLFIVNFGDCKKIYGSITEVQALNAIGNTPILEPEYFQLVDAYFNAVSDSKNATYMYSESVFRAIVQLKYDGDKTEDCIPINKFQVIENDNKGVSVFVEYCEEALEARKAYQSLYDWTNRGDRFLLKGKFEKDHKRTFHQHIIAVPKYYIEGLPLICPEIPDMQIYFVGKDNLQEWYQLPVGFNRSRAKIERNQSLSLFI